jgi:hypothetical protein
MCDFCCFFGVQNHCFLQIVHGNQSCSGHIITFLVQAYKRALPVYLPVYLIPALIVHRKGLLKRLSDLNTNNQSTIHMIEALLLMDVFFKLSTLAFNMTHADFIMKIENGFSEH